MTKRIFLKMMRMNDRFKFRAWNKVNKTMSNRNEYYCVNDDIVIYVKYSEAGDGTWKPKKAPYQLTWREAEDLILMQCTGFKDKNGKLIYEGDIVNVKVANDGRSIAAEVSWGTAVWVLKKGDLMGGLLNGHDQDNIEIIGNVYENPELLNSNL